MQGLGYQAFWCPRCGTIFAADGARYTPALVERCRSYEESVGGESPLWKQLGIAESIHLPGDRK